MIQKESDPTVILTAALGFFTVGLLAIGAAIGTVAHLATKAIRRR